MKLEKLIAFAVTMVAIATMSAPAVAQEQGSFASYGYSSGNSGWDDFYEDWIQDRLSIGLRVSTFRLQDADRPEDVERERTFLGYINKLDEEDDVNVYPTISWWLCPYISFEFTYDKAEASTWNFNMPTTDGNVIMEGPIFSLRAQYPFLDNMVIPYVGIGVAPWSADFKESPNWFTRKADGMHRVMEVEDDTGLALSAGVCVRPIRHLEIEAMVRYLDVSTDAEFWYMRAGHHRGDIAGEGEFTLEHMAYGLAASYVF